MNPPNGRAQRAANDDDHNLPALAGHHPQPTVMGSPSTPSLVGPNSTAALRCCNTDELSELECLEFLISLSSGQQNARCLAERAIEAYGSLAKVFQQPSRELCNLLDLDDMTAFLMKVTKSSMKHIVAPAISTRRGLASHEALIDYLALDFRDAEQEIVRVIYFDAKCNIIQDEEMFRGTVNTVPVYPREIGKRALSCSAASVILAHNHLTDDPTPSCNDIDTTIKIERALQSLDIILSDHVIIARGRSLSMRAEGLF